MKNKKFRFITISFNKWDGKSARFFRYRRIYYNGYKWTPFCWTEKRYNCWLGAWGLCK